jgi:hypothetical protein
VRRISLTPTLSSFLLLPRRLAATSDLADLQSHVALVLSSYSAIANQESLSTLEVEMRKLEGVVKEIVDELAYLQRREARMRDTNGSC